MPLQAQKEFDMREGGITIKPPSKERKDAKEIDSWSLPAQFRGKEEEIYRMCLNRDVTWEDAIGYEKVKDGILL